MFEPSDQNTSSKSGHKPHANRHRTHSNIDVPSPQRIALNKVAAWPDFVTHEHGEHVGGFDNIVDLHAQLGGIGKFILAQEP